MSEVTHSILEFFLRDEAIVVRIEPGESFFQLGKILLGDWLCLNEVNTLGQ